MEAKRQAVSNNIWLIFIPSRSRPKLEQAEIAGVINITPVAGRTRLSTRHSFLFNEGRTPEGIVAAINSRDDLLFLLSTDYREAIVQLRENWRGVDDHFHWASMNSNVLEQTSFELRERDFWQGVVNRGWILTERRCELIKVNDIRRLYGFGWIRSAFLRDKLVRTVYPVFYPWTT